MTSDRLRCFVSGYADPAHPYHFPEDDDHPYWREIDMLADAIHARLIAAGATEPIDGLLTTSSDTPRGCSYFWVDLPIEADQRGEMLALCLDHLSRARLALPNVSWEISLEDAPLVWDGARFSLPA